MVSPGNEMTDWQLAEAAGNCHPQTPGSLTLRRNPPEAVAILTGRWPSQMGLPCRPSAQPWRTMSWEDLPGNWTRTRLRCGGVSPGHRASSLRWRPWTGNLCTLLPFSPLPKSVFTVDNLFPAHHHKIWHLGWSNLYCHHHR